MSTLFYVRRLHLTELTLCPLAPPMRSWRKIPLAWPRCVSLNSGEAVASVKLTRPRQVPKLRCELIPDAPKPMTDALRSQAFQWLGRQ